MGSLPMFTNLGCILMCPGASPSVMQSVQSAHVMITCEPMHLDVLLLLASSFGSQSIADVGLSGDYIKVSIIR